MRYHGEGFRSKKQIIADAVNDRLAKTAKAYQTLRDKDSKARASEPTPPVKFEDLPKNMQQAFKRFEAAREAEKQATIARENALKELRSLALDTGIGVDVPSSGVSIFYKARTASKFGTDNNGFDIRSQEALDAFNVMQRAYKEAEGIELLVAVGIKNVGDFQLLLERIQRMGEK